MMRRQGGIALMEMTCLCILQVPAVGLEDKTNTSVNSCVFLSTRFALQDKLALPEAKSRPRYS